MGWFDWVAVILVGWLLLSLAFAVVWCCLGEVRYRRRAQAFRRRNER